MKKLSRQTLHKSAIGIGLCVVVLFVLSREIGGAGWLDSVSKLIEWTGMVFLPLFGLNLDLYPYRSARVAAVAMLVIHSVLMAFVFRLLPTLTFLTVTPLAVVEMFILVIPFLMLRKRPAGSL